MSGELSIGVVGMNYWGPNLARNFDRLDGCRVTWICDRDEGVLDRHRSSYPSSRFTTRYEDLLEDETLDAVVIATPVPTHAPLARLALEADKDAFVEKPLALTAKDANELADARRRPRTRPDGGPPARVPPRRPEAEGPRDRRDPGPRVLPLRQPPEPGHRPRRRERPLEPGPARHLGDAVAGRRAAERGGRQRRELPPARRRGRGLRPPEVPLGRHRAPAPELARPAQDAQDDRDRRGEDGRVRRHGDRAQGDDLRQGSPAAHRDLRRVHPGALGRHHDPADARDRAPADRVRALRHGGGRPRADAVRRLGRGRGGRGARGDERRRSRRRGVR